MLTSLGGSPTYEKISTPFPEGTSSEYLPSELVWVALCVPFSETVTATKGSPFEFFTIPATGLFCANAFCEQNWRMKSKMTAVAAFCAKQAKVASSAL